MIITLLPYEAEFAGAVGMRRQIDAIANARKPYGRGDEQKWFDHHIFGAMAEYAVAQALNLFWKPGSRPDNGTDVGGCIGVRLRRLPGSGDLPIRMTDKKHVPQVLVHNPGDLRFKLVGWLYPMEGQERREWSDISNCWYVKPPYRSIEELMDIYRLRPPEAAE